jgi:hypothetical protein
VDVAGNLFYYCGVFFHGGFIAHIVAGLVDIIIDKHVFFHFPLACLRLRLCSVLLRFRQQLRLILQGFDRCGDLKPSAVLPFSGLWTGTFFLNIPLKNLPRLDIIPINTPFTVY